MELIRAEFFANQGIAPNDNFHWDDVGHKQEHHPIGFAVHVFRPFLNAIAQ